MPHPQRITNHSLCQLQTVARWQLVDVLVEITQQLPLGCHARQQQKYRIHGQHQSGEEKQAGEAERETVEEHLHCHEICQTESEEDEPKYF